MSTTTLSGDAVLQQVYDPPTQALKTTIQANISGAQEVIISAADDSIKSYTYDSNGNPIGSTAGALNVSTTGNSTVSGTVAISGGTISTNLNGLANFQTTQYTIGTSSQQLVTPPLANRSSVSFKAICTGINAIYIGNSSGVTTATGYPLFNGDSLQLDLSTASSPYAIASTASQTLYVMEIG